MVGFRLEVICIEEFCKCLINLVGRNEILRDIINGLRSVLR